MDIWIVRECNEMFDLFFEEPVKDKYNWFWTHPLPDRKLPRLMDYSFVKKLLDDSGIKLEINVPTKLNIKIDK